MSTLYSELFTMKAFICLVFLVLVEISDAARAGNANTVQTVKTVKPLSKIEAKLAARVDALSAGPALTPSQQRQLLRTEFAQALLQTTAQARTPRERIQLVDRLIALNPETARELHFSRP
jgi:hypothetical protein